MPEKLSITFHRIAMACHGRQVSVQEILELVGARAHALVTLILSLPFLLPIPLPGLSNLFGLFIFINGCQLMFKKRLWFPQFFLRRKFSGAKLTKIFLYASNKAKWLEKWIRPRAKIFKKQGFQVLHGLILALLGIILALPLPPGTNFLPGIAVTFISIGIMEEDGLFIVLGYIMLIINVFFFALICKGITALC